MKRGFDLVVGLSALVMLVVPIVMVAILVKITSKGSVLYWSDRVGRKKKIFRMPKFRTMKLDTPEMATHLMKTPVTYLSPIGRFLRRSSLDELPQLWSILKGDMSFVGPRPALFNQDDLIVNNLENSVIAAVILVMIIILGVLGIRSGFLVGVSIPGSFLTGILALYLMGFTINFVVLFALILAVGWLVDGAIVVVEYADRKISEGLSIRESFKLASIRMSLPIIFE